MRRIFAALLLIALVATAAVLPQASAYYGSFGGSGSSFSTPSFDSWSTPTFDSWSTPSFDSWSTPTFDTWSTPIITTPSWLDTTPSWLDTTPSWLDTTPSWLDTTPSWMDPISTFSDPFATSWYTAPAWTPTTYYSPTWTTPPSVTSYSAPQWNPYTAPQPNRYTSYTPQWNPYTTYTPQPSNPYTPLTNVGGSYYNWPQYQPQQQDPNFYGVPPNGEYVTVDFYNPFQQFSDDSGNQYNADGSVIDVAMRNNVPVGTFVNSLAAQMQQYASTSDPGGACATAVAKAIEAALGLPQYSIQRPASKWAVDYGSFLEKAGMQSVLSGPGSELAKIAQKGDVVIFPGLQQFGKGHPEGHIAVFDGQKWISDYRQNDIFGGPTRRANDQQGTLYSPRRTSGI